MKVTYRMHLFVAGEEPNSRRARENLAAMCADRLSEDCDVEIVDVLENFQAALDMGIYVTPALVITRPEPRVTVFGNLSDTRRLLDALGLEER